MGVGVWVWVFLRACVRAAGAAFWKELDFVVAGVATCLLANLAAVYLSAPTVAIQVTSTYTYTAKDCRQHVCAYLRVQHHG